MKRKPTLWAALLLGCFSIRAADAAVLELDHPFGDPEAPPSGPVPWLTVTTSDSGPNVVIIEFTASNLNGSEFVSEWFLNVDPSLDASQLSFTLQGQTGAFLLPSIGLAGDGFKAGGDGFYDLRLTFDSSGTNDHRFSSGDSLRYSVSSGGGTVSAASFSFWSVPDGGDGPFLSAAHVNATGTSGLESRWIAAVPEPSAALLVLAGAGWLGRRRRRRG
jgi:hypothetical protein